MAQRQVKVQGKIIDKSDYKCNFITSHTARRTFININIRRHKTSVESVEQLVIELILVTANIFVTMRTLKACRAVITKV